MKDKVLQATTRFQEGFNCSQSVFSAFAPGFGLSRDFALRIAAPFGGGMGRMGEVCGAVSGAIMVIGLKTGSTQAGNKTAKETSYNRTCEFAARFKDRNGTILCRELLGFNIDDPDDLQRARENGLFKNQCPKYVQDSAEILATLLEEG